MNSSLSSDNSNNASFINEEDKENIYQISTNTDSLNLGNDLTSKNSLKTVRTKCEFPIFLIPQPKIQSNVAKTLDCQRRQKIMNDSERSQSGGMYSKKNFKVNEKILKFSNSLIPVKNQEVNQNNHQKRQEWYFLKFDEDYVNNLQVYIFIRTKILNFRNAIYFFNVVINVKI